MSTLRSLRARCLTLLAALLALLTLAAPVAAHPLGDFSVNRYSRLEVGADRLTVSYVLDMAEIPAFQARQRIDADGDGALSAAEAAAYATWQADLIRQRLRLTLDGAPAELAVLDQALSFPPGQGGLTTLRLELHLAAPLPAGAPVAIVYRDDNELERTGWREIVIRAGAGRTLRDASVPTADLTDALRTYPQDLLQNPLAVRVARATALPAPGVAAQAAEPTPAALGRPRDAFAALVTAEALTLPVLLVALAVAFGLGALHALAPGHGKAVVAAYLVGTRGTTRHAILLGLTVTITHTVGVFALGLVTLLLSQFILPEQLYPWLGATSGLLVVAIGLGLFWQRLRALLRAHPLRLPCLGLAPASQLPAPAAPAPTAHAHDGVWHVHLVAEAAYGRHDNHHYHQHLGLFDHRHGPDGHHHHHTVPGADGERVTWRSLLALGISGGLVPCPSALVVLLSAIALHRVGFGLLLIVAFSAGLAAVLTGIGLLLVHAGRLFARLPIEGRLQRGLPVVSALLVAVAGVAITLQALAEAGLVPV